MHEVATNTAVLPQRLKHCQSMTIDPAEHAHHILRSMAAVDVTVGVALPHIHWHDIIDAFKPSVTLSHTHAIGTD